MIIVNNFAFSFIVCATFLKTIALYLIMILAFAMSFYTLNNEDYQKNDDEESANFSIKPDQKDDDKKSFADPFMSIITVVRMMLSDFDSIDMKPEDRFGGIMLLVFIVLIAVVLFNLLNALAIRDTTEIMKDAELVDNIKRISIVSSYETLFSYFNPSFVNIFPKMSSIMLTPNRDNTVKIKRNMEYSNTNTAIMIHKTTRPPKFELLQETTLILCRKEKVPIRVSNTFVMKIAEFIRSRREQTWINANKKFIYDKVDHISREVLELKDLQAKQDEKIESLVQLSLRRQRLLNDSSVKRAVETEEFYM